jgi:hypothetical protein
MAPHECPAGTACSPVLSHWMSLLLASCDCNSKEDVRKTTEGKNNTVEQYASTQSKVLNCSYTSHSLSTQI